MDLIVICLLISIIIILLINNSGIYKTISKIENIFTAFKIEQRKVCFIRAGHADSIVKHKYPPEWILEHHFVDQLKTIPQSWEIMLEEDFKIDFIKSNDTKNIELWKICKTNKDTYNKLKEHPKSVTDKLIDFVKYK